MGGLLKEPRCVCGHGKDAEARRQLSISMRGYPPQAQFPIPHPILIPPVVDMVGEEMENGDSGLEFLGSAFNWLCAPWESKQWP